jgi:predicted nuclease of predicted toxin-antitoxin system
MSTPIRFLADENLRKRLVLGVRRIQPAIYILTASEAGILGMPDPDVLIFAAQEGRVLISHDIQTMPIHFGTHLAQQRQSAGVIIIAQLMPLRQAIDTIHIVWQASTAEEWIDKIGIF